VQSGKLGGEKLNKFESEILIKINILSKIQFKTIKEHYLNDNTLKALLTKRKIRYNFGLHLPQRQSRVIPTTFNR
jgi:hypothetical protein